MELEAIKAVIGTAASLKAFVEGGALAATLQEIGGVELDAAVLCLRNLGRARDPVREVELAVGHLQSAHFAFQRLYAGESFASASFHEVRIKRAVARAQQVNVMMAICYCYLAEPALMAESIRRAEEACEWVIEKWSLRKEVRHNWEDQGLSGLNPLNWWACIFPKGLLGGGYFGGFTEEGEFWGLLWPADLAEIQDGLGRIGAKTRR